jgi:DnaJ-class molecular chaperone
MPSCPTCRGMGKIKQTQLCMDCNGSGQVTDKMLKFIEYYKNHKKDMKAIEELTNIESGANLVGKI